MPSRLLADDSEYMTVKEFAALPSDDQHAVWAAGERLIDTIPAGGGDGIRRWHRAQVLELLNPGGEP